MTRSKSRIPARHAFAAAWLVVFLSATADAQSRPAPDAGALVARMLAARGTPSSPVSSLATEGTFEVTIEGVNEGRPCVQGKFREWYEGESRYRHTSDMGENGIMEGGVVDDLVWEVDPAAGPRILTGAAAASSRRYFAILRGVQPSSLYREVAAVEGTKTIEGREHAVLRMTPACGGADTWYVDLESGLVTRIDLVLPTPEGAELVWDLGQEVESQLTLGDWKRLEGVLYPHRHSLKMGKVTIASTCTKVEINPKVGAERFTPPDAVLKLRDKKPAAASKPDSRAGWQIVEREPQHVASIRVKCKSAEIGATITMILPEVISHLNATGARMTGPPFMRYHGVEGDELDVEAGLPVAKPVPEKGRVQNRDLPGGWVVMGWHVGPYEKLKGAHDALREFVASQRLEPRGGPWEVYWTDPGVVPDSSKWRTQLFMPIEK